MLKKLLKYEYRATYKLYLILYLIVIGLAFINRLLYALDFSRNVVLSVLSGMFTVTIVLSCIGLYFATLIFILFRFYKNLFTDEGYLMFTLPVSPLKLIISKIIVGMTWIIGSMVVIGASVAIMLFNTSTLDTLKELWNLMGYNIFDLLFDGEILQFVIFIVNYIVGVLSTICFIYLAVAFGQVMMPRHKIAGSILSYFIITIINSILSSIISLIYYKITDYDLAASQLPSSFYGLSALLNIGFVLVSIALVNKICKNHLNLS